MVMLCDRTDVDVRAAAGGDAGVNVVDSIVVVAVVVVMCVRSVHVVLCFVGWGVPELLVAMLNKAFFMSRQY